MKFDDEICKGINCPECSFNKGEDGCLLAKRLDEIEITLEPCKDAVPSVQPEIIHCRDCKYQEKGSNESETWNLCKYRPWAYVPIDDDHYCGYAERRTDG